MWYSRLLHLTPTVMHQPSSNRTLVHDGKGCAIRKAIVSRLRCGYIRSSGIIPVVLSIVHSPRTPKAAAQDRPATPAPQRSAHPTLSDLRQDCWQNAPIGSARAAALPVYRGPIESSKIWPAK